MYARLIESVSLKKVIVVKYIFTETETKFELKLSDGQFKKYHLFYHFVTKVTLNDV